MCSFADVCQFDVAMKTLRSPTFDSNPWLMQSCLSCQCTCRRTGCAVGVCGTCRSCLRHEDDTPWFQKRNDEIWKRCTFANGSKVDCMHCMHCMQYASRIGSSAIKFSLSSDVQQGQLQAMRMHSTANCFGIPSCWLLKRIASVFTSKEPYEANAARGDCRCWACWLDCRNLSALSLAILQVLLTAGHCLSARSGLTWLFAEKNEICASIHHFFAQYTPVLTRFEDSLHKSEIFGNLFHLRLSSSKHCDVCTRQQKCLFVHHWFYLFVHAWQQKHIFFVFCKASCGLSWLKSAWGVPHRTVCFRHFQSFQDLQKSHHAWGYLHPHRTGPFVDGKL